MLLTGRGGHGALALGSADDRARADVWCASYDPRLEAAPSLRTGLDLLQTLSSRESAEDVCSEPEAIGEGVLLAALAAPLIVTGIPPALLRARRLKSPGGLMTGPGAAGVFGVALAWPQPRERLVMWSLFVREVDGRCEVASRCEVAGGR